MNITPSSTYTIRFSDCDLFGHLNNGRYIDYLLNAREDHLQEAYGMRLDELYKQGLTWFVNSHEISYLYPANYNETVRIHTTLAEAAPGHLLLEMLMTDENETHIKSVMWTKFVPVDIKTGRRSQHPEDFMAFAKSIENPELAGFNYKERLGKLLEEMKAKRSIA